MNSKTILIALIVTIGIIVSVGLKNVSALDCKEKCELGTCCDTSTGLCGSCKECSADQDCWGKYSNCEYNCIDGSCIETDQPTMRGLEYCLTNAIANSKCDLTDVTSILQKATSIESTLQSTPMATMKFGGTEYNAGDNATVWLQLLRNYQPLNNATCYLTVYYPNKTVFLNNTIMQYLAGSDGIYYYDLTAPTVNGVYVSSAICYNPYNAFSDDFSNYNNLESWENITIENGKVKLSNAPTGLSNLTSNMTGNVLLYHLDELSGMIIDYSGNGNNGTDYEASYGVEGKINTALWFNGVNSVVGVVESNSWKPTDRVTVEAWVKFDEIKDNVGTIVGGYASSNGYFLAVNPYANTVYFYLNGVYYYYSVYGIGFSNNTWYHIAGTYDRYGGANNHKIYVNGQVIAQRTSSGAIGNYNLLRIGSGYGVYKFGEGTIDEVAIFNRSLSTSEILNHYNLGVGIPTTNGYIQSNPISLEGISWNNFNSIYDNKSGNIQFKILNSSDNVLCSSLGDISSCADSKPVIKLYANLTRPSINNTSPEIDKWWVEWIGATIEELRGSGEMHISSGGGCFVDLTNVTNAIANVNETQNINFQNLNINMDNNFTSTNNLIAGIISTINDTITSWGNSITSTINYWGNALEAKIDGIIMGNVTVTALVDYDEIASTVVQYFQSLGFKFPLIG